LAFLQSVGRAQPGNSPLFDPFRLVESRPHDYAYYQSKKRQHLGSPLVFLSGQTNKGE